MKTLTTFERRDTLSAAAFFGLAGPAVIAGLFLIIPSLSGAAEPGTNTATTETNKNAGWRGPTCVTMKCQDASPEEVLDDLAKAADITLQAGNAMSWASTRTVTLDVKDRPFWPVFIDACRQARVDFQTSMSERSARRIQLNPGMENHLASMPAYEAEGCLLVFQSASRTHSLQYGATTRGGVRMISGGYGPSGPVILQGAPNPETVQFTLQAELLVDPRLRPTGNVRTTLTSALDENGTSFLRPSADGSGPVYYQNQTRGLFLRVSFNLNYPTNAGKKLAKMEGSLRIPTIVKEETWEIADVLNAKPETKTVEGRSITVQSVRKSPGPSGQGAGVPRYEVKISQTASAESDAPGLRRSPNELYQLAESITLLAADGSQFSRSGSGGGANEAQVSFYAPNDKDLVPAKLIWKVATETRELVLPFAVTDLPIP
jgi:hypothetical protein